MQKSVERGLLIVLSGPSGVGKGTVLRRFINDPKLNLAYSISLTTRLPRKGETDGEHYRFVSKEYFEQCISEGKMLEYAKFVGNYYGTLSAEVENLRAQGKNVLLEIEVQGALQVKEKCPEALSIFIIPPSFSELERRIRGRRSEDEELIVKRLKKAKKEMRLMDHYKYIVCNDDPQMAADLISVIIQRSIKS